MCPCSPGHHQGPLPEGEMQPSQGVHRPGFPTGHVYQPQEAGAQVRGWGRWEPCRGSAYRARARLSLSHVLVSYCYETATSKLSVLKWQMCTVSHFLRVRNPDGSGPGSVMLGRPGVGRALHHPKAGQGLEGSLPGSDTAVGWWPLFLVMGTSP